MNMYHKITKGIGTTLLFLCLLVIGASEARAQDPVTGSWTFDFATTLAALPSADLAVYNGMEATAKQQVTGFYQGRGFTFLANGTYTMTLTGGTSRQGSWTMSNNNTKLHLTDVANGQQLVYGIATSGNFLVLSLEGAGSSEALFKSWYLVPQAP